MARIEAGLIDLGKTSLDVGRRDMSLHEIVSSQAVRRRSVEVAQGQQIWRNLALRCTNSN